MLRYLPKNQSAKSSNLSLNIKVLATEASLVELLTIELNAKSIIF